MKKVYLCGPYLNCNHIEALAWRHEATRLLGEQHVVCPTFRPEELSRSDQRAMVEQDLSDLNRCDAVLAHLWKPSAGSSMELWEAFRNKKLIATVTPKPVGAWVGYVSDFQTESLAEACRWLADRLDLRDVPVLRGGVGVRAD